mmetsp:Transcript_51300/g.164782  ORF Transcript_51300/g.164782 Transcript_51300/m.164782 type:complete len:234 (-) Transcript_51300:225-926(-)
MWCCAVCDAAELRRPRVAGEGRRAHSIRSDRGLRCAVCLAGRPLVGALQRRRRGRPSSLLGILGDGVLVAEEAPLRHKSCTASPPRVHAPRGRCDRRSPRGGCTPPFRGRGVVACFGAGSGSNGQQCRHWHLRGMLRVPLHAGAMRRRRRRRRRRRPSSRNGSRSRPGDSLMLPLACARLWLKHRRWSLVQCSNQVQAHVEANEVNKAKQGLMRHGLPDEVLQRSHPDQCRNC